MVGDPVVDVVALLAAGDHPGVGEHGQVLGDVLLAGAELLGERVDAQLAVAQQVEDAHPGRVAERAEAAGDQLGQVLGERMGDHLLLYPSNSLVV